jgi:hypothetical protein
MAGSRLGGFILGGGYVIWWATERVWGKFAGSYFINASVQAGFNLRTSD